MENIDFVFESLFNKAREEAYSKIKDIQNQSCEFLGEMDCESDCIELGVPEREVAKYFQEEDKPNVFKFEDGTFLLLNDFEAQEIFDKFDILN
jgi:hypothetical protein